MNRNVPNAGSNIEGIQQSQIIVEEQEKLNLILKTLDEYAEDIQKKIKSENNKKAKARGIHTSDSYNDFLAARDRIEQLNTEYQNLLTARQNLYSHRLVVNIQNTSTKEEMLVGLHDYYHNGNHLIYSWHNPICVHFLVENNNDIFHFRLLSNMSDDEEYDYELALKRSITIRQERVINARNDYCGNGVQIAQDRTSSLTSYYDEFLADLYTRRAESEFRNIISQLQNDQSRIVCVPGMKNILVQGCAGSGKTMVMFHRLPVLLYTDQVFQKESVFIVTPSVNYLKLFRTMFEDLEISDIEMGTVGTYYKRALARYGLNLEKRLSGLRIRINDQKHLIAEAWVYSNEFITSVENYISKLRNNAICGEQMLFQEWQASVAEYFKAVNSLIVILKNRKSIVLKKLLCMSDKNEAKRIQQDVETDAYYFEVIETYAVRLEQHLNRIGMLEEVPGTDSLQKMLEVTSEINELKDSVRKLDCLLCRLGDDYSQYGPSINDALMAIRDLELKLKKVPDFKKLIKERQISSRVENKTEIGIIESTLRYVDNALHGIDPTYDPGYRYVFSDYLYLRIVYAVLGIPKVPGDQLIIVDEAQGLAINEYRLLKEMNPEAVFNLYGDVNQHIEDTRGIDDWGLLKEILNCNYYTMNYNYRNCCQISDYCSRRFKVEMKSINIPGKEVVELENKEELNQYITDWYTNNPGDGMSALIYKNTEIPGYVRRLLRTSLNVYVVNNQNAAQTDQLNLVHLSRAKGLEFRRVILIEDKMTEREKFVACTRALEELVVCRKGLY